MISCAMELLLLNVMFALIDPSAITSCKPMKHRNVRFSLELSCPHAGDSITKHKTHRVGNVVTVKAQELIILQLMI